MRLKSKRLLSLGLIFTILMSLLSAALPITVLAADTFTEGSYNYTVADGKATIISYFGGDSECIMIPSILGGYPVTTIGDGMQTVFSNNKTRGIVLIPNSVTKISKRAIYDYNVTYYFTIPDSVTTIEDGATSSIAIATICGAAGSETKRYASQIGASFSSDVVNLAATAEKGGIISNSGTYLIPKTLEKTYNLAYSIKADNGYMISDLVVDGVSVSEAKSKASYTLNYALKTSNTKNMTIKVTFVVDPNATTTDSNNSGSTTTTTTTTNGDEVADAGASAGKYANAMGICGGAYYTTVVDGKNVIYKLVKTYSTNKASEKFKSKTEVKDYAAKQGLVYGVDYDYIHLYNYCDTTDTNKGESSNGKAYYVAYLYKTYTGSLDGQTASISNLEDATSSDTSNRVYNTSGIFAQNKSSITMNNFTAKSYSTYTGPTEGGNFYGANSAILADGGAVINLINPLINGLANSVFATYSGKVNITGGGILAGLSGSHGPYAAYGGKIFINTTENAAAPKAATRPTSSLASITRNKTNKSVELTNKAGKNVTSIITTDEASTALATDTGGGKIVANNVLAKAYGIRSAGVYSIGSNEGIVNVYNSNLTSYLDAGLVSASGGYIYASNSIIQGVTGIKTRAGQNSTKMSEVRVKNSSVTAYYDKDEMDKVYDVSSPSDVANSNIISKNTHDSFELNMFVDKANQWDYNKASLSYWFGDGYTNSPGHSGGNKIAVIYTDGSKTPIYVDSTKLENKNYTKYKNVKGSKAKNLIISSEGNGTANVYFINENSKTKWDLTGKDKSTTKIVGDFNVAQASKSSSNIAPASTGSTSNNTNTANSTGSTSGNNGTPLSAPSGTGNPPTGNPPTGAPPSGNMGTPGGTQSGNYLNATFTKSEWEGTVIGVSKNANLTFDANSSWKVTANTTVNTLTVAKGTVISASKPVTITCSKLIIKGKGFKFGKNVTVKYTTRQVK